MRESLADNLKIALAVFIVGCLIITFSIGRLDVWAPILAAALAAPFLLIGIWSWWRDRD